MSNDKLSTSAGSQRLRLLSALRESAGKGVTSHFANIELGIYHPPARIKELRCSGYRIETLWEKIETERCKARKVARYVLLAEHCSQPSQGERKLKPSRKDGQTE